MRLNNVRWRWGLLLLILVLMGKCWLLDLALHRLERVVQDQEDFMLLTASGTLRATIEMRNQLTQFAAAEEKSADAISRIWDRLTPLIDAITPPPEYPSSR